MCLRKRCVKNAIINNAVPKYATVINVIFLGTVDWSEAASPTAHIFVPTSSNVQRCYLLQV